MQTKSKSNIKIEPAKQYSRVVNKGYSEGGASHTKRSLKGMRPNSGAPYQDIDENNSTLRQRARMLYQTAPICTSAIKTNRTNVIGNGLRLKSTIDAEALGMTEQQANEWQKRTEAEFELWASRKNACDATGMNDFYGIQQLCISSQLLSGDVFVLRKIEKRTTLMPYSLRLHVVEADRCRTPETRGTIYPTMQTRAKLKNGNVIYDGVEVNPGGMVVAYHFANTYPYESFKEETKWTRVEAYGNKTGLPNIMHLMESERPDQYRGVPYLAQVVETMLQIRRYTESEIMAALVQSFYTAFVVTEENPNMIPMNEANGEYQDGISDSENDYEMGAGTINILKPGEDVKFGQPTHPHTGFDVFVKALCTQVGAALEIPRDLLLKEFNASYSASRAALMEAWKTFRMRRVWLTNDLCRPVYELFMTEAVALGRIVAPGFLTDPLIRQAYLSSEWIGAPAGQLDPTKEVQAAILAIDNGLSTREAEAIKLNGSEYAANVAGLKTENGLLNEANKGRPGGNNGQVPLESTGNDGKNNNNTNEMEGETDDEGNE